MCGLAIHLNQQVIMGKGSHGKILYFTVTSVQITNTVTNVVRYDNANFKEKLGKIPTHGQGPAHRTQADAERVANEVIMLYNDEIFTDINWDHFSQ